MTITFYPNRKVMLKIIGKSYPESLSSGIELLAVKGSDQQVRIAWDSLQRRLSHIEEIDRRIGIKRT